MQGAVPCESITGNPRTMFNSLSALFSTISISRNQMYQIISCYTSELITAALHILAKLFYHCAESPEVRLCAPPEIVFVPSKHKQKELNSNGSVFSSLFSSLFHHNEEAADTIKKRPSYNELRHHILRKEHEIETMQHSNSSASSHYNSFQQAAPLTYRPETSEFVNRKAKNRNENKNESENGWSKRGAQQQDDEAKKSDCPPPIQSTDSRKNSISSQTDDENAPLVEAIVKLRFVEVSAKNVRVARVAEFSPTFILHPEIALPEKVFYFKSKKKREEEDDDDGKK